ncbi:hypothetical protein WJX73_006126 [Symbiochloris irregularis]|uniref:RING-type domain-containing protein n=1 Tax=Symbiochloris irregularis TaxID=706552 RepID=A0AAW1PJZ9_9CHLO
MSVVCGICQEEPLAEVGQLDCCDHSFCPRCILQWAEIESRCPFCKARFRQVNHRLVAPARAKTRSSAGTLVSVLGKSLAVHEIPERNQVAHDEVAVEGDETDEADPMDDVFCMVCHGGDNEDQMVLCDGCERGCHTFCAQLDSVPDEESSTPDTHQGLILIQGDPGRASSVSGHRLVSRRRRRSAGDELPNLQTRRRRRAVETAGGNAAVLAALDGQRAHLSATDLPSASHRAVQDMRDRPALSAQNSRRPALMESSWDSPVAINKDFPSPHRQAPPGLWPPVHTGYIQDAATLTREPHSLLSSHHRPRPVPRRLVSGVPFTDRASISTSAQPARPPARAASRRPQDTRAASVGPVHPCSNAFLMGPPAALPPQHLRTSGHSAQAGVSSQGLSGPGAASEQASGRASKHSPSSGGSIARSHGLQEDSVSRAHAPLDMEACSARAVQGLGDSRACPPSAPGQAASHRRLKHMKAEAAAMVRSLLSPLYKDKEISRQQFKDVAFAATHALTDGTETNAAGVVQAALQAHGIQCPMSRLGAMTASQGQ